MSLICKCGKDTVIPENNLITGIELRRKLMGIQKSTLSKAFDAGYNSAINEIIGVIKENIRPEILAFAEAMEAEMRNINIQNNDIRYVYQELESIYNAEIWQLPIDEINPEAYIKAALYCMMLWWRAKDEKAD